MLSASQRLYRKVADELAAAIRGGAWRTGQKLPSERDLAERYGVSRPSIREAMIALEIYGLVEIRQGSGIYVVEPRAGAGGERRTACGARKVITEGEGTNMPPPGILSR